MKMFLGFTLIACLNAQTTPTAPVTAPVELLYTNTVPTSTVNLPLGTLGTDLLGSLWLYESPWVNYTTGSGPYVRQVGGQLSGPTIDTFLNTPLSSIPQCPAGYAFASTDINGIPQCNQIASSVVPHISFTFGWPNTVPPASATFYLTPYWGGTSESSGLASTVYPVWQSCTVDSLTAVFGAATAPAPSSAPVTFNILDNGTQVGTLGISAPVFSSIAETIYTGSGTGGAVSSGTGLQLQMKTPAWTSNPSGMVGGMVIVGCAL